MSVLLLRLAGPLQSWGVSGRFTRRTTESAPTKSGIIGLLAAAQGLRRTDPLEELLDLRLAVRIEQQGRLIRDFHTAHNPVSGQSMPLSYRYYLSDAVFLAAVEGEAELVRGLSEAVRAPEFPLYLGRRSCPPSGPLSLGLREGTARQVARQEPWRASPAHQKKTRASSVILHILADAEPADPDRQTVRDHPVSFNPHNREYTWRDVHRESVRVDNPCAPAGLEPHDPFAALGG